MTQLSRLRLLMVAGLTAALAGVGGGSDAASDFSVKTEKRGDEVHVDARASLLAPLAVVWQTLTDYDRLPDFISGISKSRLLEYRSNAAIVEQVGQAGFLFFTVPIDVVVESMELPPHRIDVRLIKGNLKKLDGRYEIEEGATAADPIVLRWHGTIEPEKALPPLIGELILRNNVTRQFRDMVNEIERRGRQAGVRAEPPK
ncbi:MAG TPA: SRPBCC family protein [Burkholderiales bacterium]